MERTHALGSADLNSSAHFVFCQLWGPEQVTRPLGTPVSSLIKHGSEFLLHRIRVKIYWDASSLPHQCPLLSRSPAAKARTVSIQVGNGYEVSASLGKSGRLFDLKKKKMPKKICFIKTGKKAEDNDLFKECMDLLRPTRWCHRIPETQSLWGTRGLIAETPCHPPKGVIPPASTWILPGQPSHRCMRLAILLLISSTLRFAPSSPFTWLPLVSGRTRFLVSSLCDLAGIGF